MGRAEERRLAGVLGRMGPKVCCECRSRLRPADAEEFEAIDGLLRGADHLEVHQLVGAKVCVKCGHVTVLSYRGDALAVWCPGFGLHRRLVSMN